MKYTNEAIKKRTAIVNRLKLFTKILVYIIILPITIFNIALLVKSYTIPDKTPDLFGFKTYVIVSGSMTPKLNIGDVIIVKYVEKDKLSAGDIISFRINDSIITHRIVDVVDGEFQTQGDYNNTPDTELVKYENIEGKYVLSIPYLGKIVFLLQNKILIIVIVILLYLMYMHNLKLQTKKEIRREKHKNLNIKR